MKSQLERILKPSIVDCRPASGLFIEGLSDDVQIPNAIVCGLKNGDQIIYIPHVSDDHTIDEYWRDVKPVLKQQYDERVAKNSDRIEYAIQQFEKYEISYKLKNQGNGHFHCWRKSDNKLFQFWASTGKILGYNNRGIALLIKELLQ